LFDFSIAGEEIKQEWIRSGFEATHQLNDRLSVTASILASTRGEDPQVSTGINLCYQL